MLEQATIRIDSAGHPAVLAWCRLRSVRVAPDEVQVLKDRKASKAYRLVGIGPGHSSVIAKWCSQQSALREQVIYKEVLAYFTLPGLRHYGLWRQTGEKFCWVFIEDAGSTRYDPKVHQHCVLAAEWLGVLHTCGTQFAAQLELQNRNPS